MIIAFDLGGSGMRVAVFDEARARISPTLNLGRCEGTGLRDLREWFDAALRQVTSLTGGRLAKEPRMGFSLAGLRKLFASPRVEIVSSLGRDASAIRELFGLSSGMNIAVLEDGDAHLLAAIRASTPPRAHPHLNLAVGTSVGFGLTDAQGRFLSATSLVEIFGTQPWLLPPSPGGMNDATVARTLGGRGLEDLRRADPRAATAGFSAAWGEFVTDVLLVRLCLDGRPLPRVISFTGGVVDHHGLDLSLVRRCVERFCTLRRLPRMVVRKGPADAGINGAALGVMGMPPRFT